MTTHNWPGTRKDLRLVEDTRKPKAVIPLSWRGRLLRWFKHLR